MEDHIDIIKRMRNIDEKTITIRGTIISNVITLERVIDECIALYFVDKKNLIQEMRDLLLSTNRITLDSKKDVLFEIFKKKEYAWNLEYPKLKTYIKDLIELRNSVAHYQVSFIDNIQNFESEINLIKQKNITSSITITNEKFEEFKPMVTYCLTALLTFTSLYQDFEEITTLKI